MLNIYAPFFRVVIINYISITIALQFVQYFAFYERREIFCNYNLNIFHSFGNYKWEKFPFVWASVCAHNTLNEKKANCREKCRSQAFWLDAAQLFSFLFRPDPKCVENLEQLIRILSDMHKPTFVYAQMFIHLYGNSDAFQRSYLSPGQKLNTLSPLLSSLWGLLNREWFSLFLFYQREICCKASN